MYNIANYDYTWIYYKHDIREIDNHKNIIKYCVELPGWTMIITPTIFINNYDELLCKVVQ